jgi:2-succinyl-6-hydroxy-2,4-cyclohexadiene-1-carboxylate synthase
MARLILLHGFTQTAHSWRRPADALRARGHEVVALDLPGHGRGIGPSHLVEGDLWDGAESVAGSGGRGTWVGYSMGARLALHVALARPEVVERLVLLGGTAGIDDPAERTDRRAHDQALASRIETIGVDAFLDTWLAQPLFAGRPSDEAELAGRRTNTAAGLASSLRHWGTGTMDPPLWDRLGELTMPTLILAGAADPKFTALGRRMADTIGATATVAAVPAAGHAAHLERPDAFAELVDAWLNQQGGVRPRG